MSLRIPIWFDIDGTLVHTRVGKEAFQYALLEVYGWEDSFENVVFAGNTDLQVLMDFSSVYAGDPEHVLPDQRQFFELMAVHLDKGLSMEPPSTVPGAAALLERLIKEEGIVLGLITGNARDCAYLKLKYAEMDSYFSEGGFGDEHRDRNRLAVIAQEKFQKEHGKLTAGWIIGDTPRDVQAAKHIGARCLGVSSNFSEEALFEAGADHVVNDLSPTDELMALLLNA